MSVLAKDAPTISKLEGMGYQLGGSVGIISPSGFGVLAGGEFNIIDAYESDDKLYHGATGILGITKSPGAELHVEMSDTQTRASFNIYELLSSLYHSYFY